MNLERASHAAIKVKNFVIVCGGQVSNLSITAKCEAFNLATEEWTNFAEMNFCIFILITNIIIYIFI